MFHSPAACASVVPSCQYQLGGSTFPVAGPLPCSNGATWSFTAASTPSVNFQVACNVPSNAALVPVFSEANKICGTSSSRLNVTVTPTGNTCGSQLTLGAFTGMGHHCVKPLHPLYQAWSHAFAKCQEAEVGLC
jgi:hypothetical protein